MRTNLKNMTDEELYSLLQKDKKEARAAFEVIYNRYSTKVYTYCLKILYDQELAEDVFQETFLKFYESAKKEREMTNVGAFLFRIARNLSINEKQRKHHSFVSFEEVIYPVNSLNYDNKEKKELIDIALAALPKKYREVIVLKEFLGFSYKEISNVLGYSLASVRIRIYRAKQRLRELLAPYIDEYQNKEK